MIPMRRSQELDTPTDAELSILQVLWQRGPSTVREVFEAIAPEGHIGYTAVLKLMQIMAAKGLVSRDDSERAHIYYAEQSEETAQRRLTGDFVEKVFGGSSQQLVLQALASHKASTEELAEIRRLLDELEGKV
jgi:BlaI family transcriptional regulator, penicillinase repressor